MRACMIYIYNKVAEDVDFSLTYSIMPRWQVETPHLRVETCSLQMETPLRGRSGGHTGAAPTISHVAPCPKVAGEVLADGLK